MHEARCNGGESEEIKPILLVRVPTTRFYSGRVARKLSNKGWYEGEVSGI